jgi:CRISPR-associated protein Csx17
LAEVHALFAEGRLTLGREQARDGVESTRAVTTLGVQRGLSEFVRYGFLERNGRSYLATPMGRFAVHREQSMELLDWGNAGQWLHRFREATKSPATPPRFTVALGRFDRAVLDAARFGGPQRVADVLAALGAIERELSVARRPGHVGTLDLLPLPLLHSDWWQLADDGSREFRLARGLVSLGQADGSEPLRRNLEPVNGDGRLVWWDTEGARCVVRGTSVVRLLTGVLERRLLDLGVEGLRAASSVSLGDVGHFLVGASDEPRLFDLIWGLALVARPAGGQAQRRDPAQTTDASPEDDVIVPRAWALTKLVFIAPGHHTDSELSSAGGAQAAPRRLILGRLRAGDLDGAAREASRRLRVGGLVPLPGPRSGGGERPAHFLSTTDLGHLQAALLLPISQGGEAQLLRLVVRATSSSLIAGGAQDEQHADHTGGA